MDKTERMILRDHFPSKLRWLCIALVANIISSYRKSDMCSDYIFSSRVLRLLILGSPVSISFVRSTNLPTVSVPPPPPPTSMYDILRRTVEAICRDKSTNNISFESN
jgi:hypothetical protein